LSEFLAGENDLGHKTQEYSGNACVMMKIIYACVAVRKMSGFALLYPTYGFVLDVRP
jgi:hypothetical protein